MMRTLAVLRFEIRQQVRQPLFVAACALAFLLPLAALSSDAVRLGDDMPGVMRNSPFSVAWLLLGMSMIGSVVIAFCTAQSLLRDFELRTHPLIATTMLNERELVAGRIGAVIIVSALMPLLTLGAVAIAPRMPWSDPARLGLFPFGASATAFLALALPNLVIAALLATATALLTRSTGAVYTSPIAMLAGCGLALSHLGRLSTERLASLADPFGFAAFQIATRHAGVFERNHAALPWSALLANRGAWLAVAVVAAIVAARRFAFDRASAVAAEAPEPPLRNARVRSGKSGALSHAIRFETSLIVRNVPLWCVAALGLLNLVGSGSTTSTVFDTEAWPVTRLMVHEIESSLLFFVLLALLFAAGESVWRERTLRVSDWLDATPARSSVLWGSKLAALGIALALLIALGGAATIAMQAMSGHSRFEPLLYAKAFALEIAPELLAAIVLSYFVIVVSGNKYAGLLLAALSQVGLDFMRDAGVHPLLRFGSPGRLVYSDLNGYGSFVAPGLWLTAYWICAVIVLLAATSMMWSRGATLSFRARLREAWRRAAQGPGRIALAASLGMLAVGAFIFVNTNVWNRYDSSRSAEARLARFEHRTRSLASLPQPKIVDGDVAVEIFPAKRRATIRGSYRLANRGDAPIKAVHVFVNPDLVVETLELRRAGAWMASRAPDLGLYVFTPGKPLAPGEEVVLRFGIADVRRGFRADDTTPAVVANGTFFDSRSHMPHIGVPRIRRLESASARRRYGLPPAERMASIDDRAAWMRNELSPQADWTRFSIVIGTSDDQTPVSSGRLTREWSAAGRRYARYAVDGPNMFFLAFASGRYAERRETWNGVELSVLYDARHAWNVERMLRAMKATLAHCSARYGPFPGRALRIVEFPRYRRFAQSLPGMIPFSEDSGFLARVREGDVDHPFLVTAHEVAHQWWGHQAVGADVEGAAMLSESLAQYTAGAVLREEYGEDALRRLLEYERSRYEAGRARETIAEKPLMTCEQQPYVHYSKGALALHALAAAVGSAQLDAALADYLRAWRFAGPPYPTSREVVSRIAARLPAAERWLIEDYLETITFHDVRAVDASIRGGRVEVAIELRRTRADGNGAERAVPPRAWLDVAALDSRGREIARSRVRLTGARTTVAVPVPVRPAKVVLDPDIRLLERNRDDNEIVPRLSSTRGGDGTPRP